MQKVAPTTLTMGLVTWTHKSSLELKENTVIKGTVQFCSFSRVFFCVVSENVNYIHLKEGHFFLIPRGRGVLSLKICKGKYVNYRG